MATKIKIAGKEFELSRLKLKDWSRLESLKVELDTATSKHDITEIFNCMVKFIEVAILPSPSKVEWDKLPWYEFAMVYDQAVRVNLPTIDFPILHGGGSDNKKQPWEYGGRAWYFWFSLFAANFGWTEDVIANLDIDDALGLYQEIQLNEQLQREWEWGLSEIAYPYDKSTKTSKYMPLTRPSWMMPLIPKQLPVVKMKKSHVPMGNIVDLSAKPEKETKDGI